MFFNSLSNKSAVCLYDVLSGRKALIEQTPFKVGSGAVCDWKIEQPQVPEEWFEIQRKGSNFFVAAGRSTDSIVFNAEPKCRLTEIEEKADHIICIAGEFLLLRKTRKPTEWLAKLDYRKWFIYDEASGNRLGPYAPDALATEVHRYGGSGDAILLCEGMRTRGFLASMLLPALAPDGGFEPAEPAEPSSHSPFPPNHLSPPTDSEHGEFTCPVCWLKFDRGDVMNIAAHTTLRGDPLLGEFEMQRFHATRFTDRGIALDPMNIPALDQACPHCRRKLPPAFLDQPHHIFSIIGAPSAGKSYFLSVLTRRLQEVLFRNFGISFRDADPTGNRILNQMVSRLFGQSTPEEAYLAKTDLEGELYETLPRHGQNVKLPRPFIFNLSRPLSPEDDFSVIFYDNAGEHFQPGRNSTDSPGAQHIAVASGIFFLFDPLHSPDFLRHMGNTADPQAADKRDEQQEVLLAETEVRIKSLLGLSSRDKITTPLAVMIGKCDTWLHLLGSEPLEPSVRDGRLDLMALLRNSSRLRSLLCEITPAMVSNAEAISSEVMFFAISPLGSSPVVFTDASGIRKVGPDPSQIAPVDVEVPALWCLSQLAPSMIPSIR